MRNTDKSGTVNERNIIQAIRTHLPAGWTIESNSNKKYAFLVFKAPDNRKAKLALVARKHVPPRSVPDLLHQISSWELPGLLVAPFLSPRSREMLAAGGINFIDHTGNMRVVVSSPAIFFESKGSDHDPNKQPRKLRSLKGAATSRVVRALCDFLPPYGTRMLASASSTPLGSVSRVVNFLEEEAMLTRDSKKQITAVDWPTLIGRWTKDYSIARSNTLTSFIEPRGLHALKTKLSRLGRYAATGSLAGPSIAPTRLAMIYVDNSNNAANMLELVATDAGANVWLLEPFDSVVFERTQTIQTSHQDDPIIAAAPSQVAADLLTSPGRGPQEGEALIQTMKETENAWRKQP